MLGEVVVDNGAKLNWSKVVLDSKTRKISFENAAQDREFEYCGIDCREIIITEENGNKVLMWTRVPFEKTVLDDGSLNPIVFIEFGEGEEKEARDKVKKRFATVVANQGKNPGTVDLRTDQ